MSIEDLELLIEEAATAKAIFAEKAAKVAIAKKKYVSRIIVSELEDAANEAEILARKAEIAVERALRKELR